MAKLTLTDLGNFNSTGLSVLNANWDLIVAALENTLSRDGTTPNSMSADLDLNDNDILNVGAIDCTTLTLNGEVFDGNAPVWVVGSGAPASGTGDNGDMYLDGSSGDIYGPKASGSWPASVYTITGVAGPTGPTGDTGEKGWSPVFSIQNNGAARVLRLDDWVGGEGTKPATGTYVGTTGLVAAIGDAVDIRGPQGPEGPAGAGTGDMLAATYDPGGVADDAFDMENMTEGTTNKIFSASERSKLSGIATGATANSSDATLLNRANHTGTQAASTISDFNTEVDSRADARIAAKADVAIIVAASDETTALTTGTAKVTFRMPFAMTLTGIRASLTTAQTSGSIFTVDVNESGTTILSTKITIDNTEKTSTTAATAPVISDTSLADDAEITVDIDQIGDGTAKGLKVSLIGYKT